MVVSLKALIVAFRCVVMLGVVVGGVIVAGTGAGAEPRSVIVSGPVTALAAASNDGRAQHVAFVVRERGCDTLQVWRLLGRPQTLAPRDCRSTVFGLSMSDYGALWATVREQADGGRLYEVWRATSGWARGAGFSAPYGKRTRLFDRLVPRVQPAPLVMGDGVYAVDSALYAFDSSRFSHIPPLDYRPRKLLALPGGINVVVLRPGGVLERYDSARPPSEPTPHATFDFAPGSVKAIKAGAVLEPRRLSWWGSTFEGSPSQVAVPAAASYGDDRCYEPDCSLAELRLADTQGPYAIYVLGRSIHVLRPLDGRDRILRTPVNGPVHAQMEPGGVTYSSGNRIFYIPREEIDALFAR